MRASRAALLGQCTSLFDRHTLSHEGDSFPRISGRIGDRNVDVRLICDTMTMRRLPQLWLQTTVLARMPANAGFAILVRPSNYEFYSLTGEFEHVIEPPAGFPSEVIIRGETARASALLAKLSGPIADILQDPLVKEIAVTRQGLRIIRQADEGRRGDHLLLRQAVFDKGAVPAAALQSVLRQIESLHAAAFAQESVAA
ncbi:MAG TPA: hypothetical protein VHO05_17410 [Hyphomicrobium sp.]|nr:hypothetical protein [Hyphomicrobium sp.]